jgi:hypothetical protein
MGMRCLVKSWVALCIGLELFGAPLIGLRLVFAAMFSDLPEQVTDECVGEDSL